MHDVDCATCHERTADRVLGDLLHLPRRVAVALEKLLLTLARREKLLHHRGEALRIQRRDDLCLQSGA